MLEILSFSMILLLAGTVALSVSIMVAEQVKKRNVRRAMEGREHWFHRRG